MRAPDSHRKRVKGSEGGYRGCRSRSARQHYARAERRLNEITHYGQSHRIRARRLALKLEGAETQKRWTIHRQIGTNRDRHFVRIATELRNIELHPLQCQLLIEEAEVILRNREIRGRGEAEDIRPVVAGDDDDILVRS